MARGLHPGLAAYVNSSVHSCPLTALDAVGENRNAIGENRQISVVLVWFSPGNALGSEETAY